MIINDKIFKILGLPNGFHPEDEFWISLCDLEYPINFKILIFKFEDEDYIIPKCLMNVVKTLPFTLMVDKIAWKIFW